MAGKLSFDQGDGVGRKSPEILQWTKELDAAKALEKDWRKEGARLVKVYECEKKDDVPFNILFSNTETLAPALYNNTPRPVVQRRFKDDSPQGKVASIIVQRSLEYLLDNTIGDYSTFDDLMMQAVLEALVPGRGVTRFKFDATFVEVEGPQAQEEATGEEEGVAHEASERVAYATVCGEHVPWERFRHGYAKQWKDVPWIAFEHFFTKEECEKNFPGVAIPCTFSPKASETVDELEGRAGADETSSDRETLLAQVFEIWDKSSKKVYFLAPAKQDGFVKVVEDPLELQGFFPIPKPLQFFAKVSSLVPVPLYSSYEDQARELNIVTVRIKKVIQALKVRGFYDGTLEGLDRLMQSEDNTLLPAENVAAMQQGQTLEKAIWLMPLAELVGVLQQLYIQRQQIKQVIYEITGISDILRGASVASETATAQNIKNQWGTLRLKRMQKLVMVYVRQSLRIMAEIACSKIPTDILAQMTGMNFPTQGQKVQAQQLLQQAQGMGQQLPPAQQASLQQLQQLATLPSWEELQALLSNDLQRNYLIDIETNSTVDSEATEDKQNIGEFLNAVAQFLNGIGPLVQQGMMPFDSAKAMLLAVVRRYRFGTDVEDQIRSMQAPPPPQQQEDAAAQAKAKQVEQEGQLRMKELEMELQFKQVEYQLKVQELQRKAEFAAMQHQAKMASARQQAEQRAQQLTLAGATPKSAGITSE